MTELKKCPFCNGEAEKEIIASYRYSVKCTKCMTVVDGGSIVEAIAAWNTRTGLTIDEIRGIMLNFFPYEFENSLEFAKNLMQEFEKARDK